MLVVGGEEMENKKEGKRGRENMGLGGGSPDSGGKVEKWSEEQMSLFFYSLLLVPFEWCGCTLLSCPSFSFFSPNHIFSTDRKSVV